MFHHATLHGLQPGTRYYALPVADAERLGVTLEPALFVPVALRDTDTELDGDRVAVTLRKAVTVDSALPLGTFETDAEVVAEGERVAETV